MYMLSTCLYGEVHLLTRVQGWEHIGSWQICSRGIQSCLLSEAYRSNLCCGDRNSFSAPPSKCSFSRERLAEGSCCVGLLLAINCPSRPRCRRVVVKLQSSCRQDAVKMPPRCRRIEHYDCHRVQGLEFRVQGLRFRVCNLRFRV